MRTLIALLALSLSIPAWPAPAVAAPATLAGLSAGDVQHGFRAIARYRNGAREPMGARFVHVKSGFTLDVLGIQSVPQGFIWVNTWPTSDKGEPHTQEHLLLGKGNRGRAVATLDSMSLADENAYTEQRRTCYQFNTAAGPEVFYDLLEKRIDAMLRPDYSDEEIRREVRHFGVSEVAGKLRLDEKGTVYNEMVSTYEKPWARVFRQLSRAIYGPNHPLSLDSGGTPEALRVLDAADIRRFHREHYHLANMGMVASLPKEMALDDVLARLDGILGRLEPGAGAYLGRFKTDAELPAPNAGAKRGGSEIVGFPDENATSPGQLIFAWPATFSYANATDRSLAALFAGAFAGDATTNLYKAFIDSKTRRADLGATSAFSYFDEDGGHPFFVGFTDVGAAHLTPASIDAVRAQVLRELEAVAAMQDGSPELEDFNGRVRASISQWRRSLSQFVNTPPGFGFRDTGSSWSDHLNQLNRAPGFDKSVTMEGEIAAIEAMLASGKNVWRDLIRRAKLAETLPTAVAAKPEPALVEREAREREARIRSELSRLKAQYGVKDEQAALKRYQADYARATSQLEKAEAASASLRFLAHPPLERDPLLDYRTLTLAPGVPLVASTFDNMASATVGLALRVDAVPAERLHYLSLLPTLMTSVGVLDNGRPVSYEEMSQRLSNEVLRLDASYSNNALTRRCELVIRGAGNDAQESAQAIEWMKRVAFAPDWRVENLPRLRDVVDQAVGSLHGRMKEAEERWVNDPAGAYRNQGDPLQLATGSFLTIEHNAHRLRWLLRDAGGGADRAAIATFLTALADAPAQASRKELQALVTAFAEGGPQASLARSLAAHVERFEHLPAGAKANAREAAKDLALYLADLPDDSLGKDWAYLCAEMRDGLLVPPSQALEELNGVRRALLNASQARLFMVGSRSQQEALLAAPVPSLLAGLDRGASRRVEYARDGLVTARLRERVPAAAPIFVGLVNPNTQSGVFLNRAPLARYEDTDRESLLGFLASKLYGGGGAQSIFMKTWGAGLAYSNGLRSSEAGGALAYYAERCPDLPQTLRFVVGELKKARRDPNLVEYAYALAFDDSRTAQPYEARGEAMAADLADGLTPQVVRRFRESMLALRSTPNLVDELYRRMPAVYGRVLPGLAGKAGTVKDGVFFVIGPEKQMRSYETYLRSVEGPETRLYRLYPRDFWAVAR